MCSGRLGWPTAARDRITARNAPPPAPSDGSSRFGSCAGGGHTGIAYLLGMHPSTVHRVLTRYGLAKLRWLDRPTGRVIRRIESLRCGDLVHVDVKKLGKIPAGGGWRILGRTAGNRNSRNDTSSGVKSKRYHPLHGHHFLHTALDGHSRLAYSELLTDERQDTAAGFWLRANAWFADHGITVRKVLTDNGSCYRSRTFADALGAVEHRRTRPYRPQTNGKVERFHRTLADEWAYARLYTSDAERCQEFPIWLHTYNHHRGHTALGGQPPASRVPNLSGQNS
ncbi:integrase catalytic subunit [Mycobacterium intracellulare subsp. yongonense 05-1390]|nr:integrase catalytic subunit [Mycobacterium intracellulare subsp. yongonense 05-1390]AGP63071.1 integrase catalytic subunit [Mycobacterium intracellulare subsp. yongonense 05-1390]AGP63410.1 integrase catalytic subunit [Mycobacterium intracellulare subsp. yongonense 05-1390]ARR81672.1 transposase [Mycobacterium intracellulare subsp. yongonense]